MVVATSAMPLADWRRARVLAWTTALLHFDKLVQIPLVVAHEVSGIGYRTLLDAFVNADPAKYPLLAEVEAFFEGEARTIQAGGPELHYAPDFLGIWWPADEFMFIKLTHERKIEAFFAEARQRLLDLWEEHGTPAPFAPVDDAFALNRALLSQPFVFDDAEVTLGHDVWRFFRGILQGEPETLRAKRSTYRIERSKEAYSDFATWCREVVWYGHRRGAYYHSGRMVEVETETELAGHY
jgi:hypothetical protein